MRFSRDCCAAYNYTTRKYDLDGLTIWKADYFQRMPVAYASTVVSCSYATTGTRAATYSNGASGVGATLESTTNIAFTIDGFTPSAGVGILVKDQTTPEHNGIYTLTQAGSAGSHWILTRRTDFDAAGEIVKGTIVDINAGTLNGGTQWVTISDDVVTVGTDAITWTNADLFGTTGKNVRAQAVDDNRVYVGGSRCTTNGFHSWSIVAFDVDTGELLWDYDLDGDCRKILINPDDGNVVCMVAIEDNFDGLAGLYYQHFITLQPDGTFVSDDDFIQVLSPGAGAGAAVRTLDFEMNNTPDVHTLGFLSGPALADTIRYTEVYDNGSLSEVDLRMNMSSLTRSGSDAYIAAAVNGTNSLAGALSYLLPWKTPKIAKYAISAAPTINTDFTWLYPNIYYDNTAFPKTTDGTTITGTGTTQAGALLLTANTNYTSIAGASGSGFRLPTGAAGDIVALDMFNSGTSTGGNTYWLYPPTGGTFLDSVITRDQMFPLMFWLCTAPGRWVPYFSNSIGFPRQLSRVTTNQIAIDSTARLIGVNARTSSKELTTITSSNIPAWRTLPAVAQWLCLDTDDNIYLFGNRAGSVSSQPTITKRDSTGAFVWAHRHSGTELMYDGSGNRNAEAGYASIQFDTDKLHIICSGFDDSNGVKGPNDSRNDYSFLSNPDAAPTPGRSAVGTDTGVNPDYAVGFIGAPCASGAWIVAIINDDSGGDATITGGSTWTRASGGEINVVSHSCQLWYKRCGASEPATYTVSSGGNGSACTLLEILDANATNPDDIQTSTNTATAPTATQSALNALAVVVAADDTIFTAYTEPSGYTLMDGSSFQGTSAIAVKTLSGAGSVSPGNWTGVSGTTSFVWTLIFKS